MKAYVWTMVIVIALESFGKAALLVRGDLSRKPGHELFDIALGIVFVGWGAYLLGAA